jgi:hypothetical protein
MLRLRAMLGLLTWCSEHAASILGASSQHKIYRFFFVPREMEPNFKTVFYEITYLCRV